MQLTEILSKLHNVKKSGDQHTAQCPAHDDKQNSLSITGGEKCVVLHCHAGCSAESVVAAIGIEMSNLFYDRPTPKGKKEIETVYDYTDINGKLLHSSVRYKNPKGFSQRRPDPSNPEKLIYDMKGIETVIYNLPAVSATINEKKPIFIVEGEKDADNLGKLGFTATTNPMGAGKWRGHHSNYLVDADVYIVPDNDDTGKSHAVNVAKSLAGKAKSIKMIDLTKELPSLPDKGDVTDFFRLIGSKQSNPAQLRQNIFENSKRRLKPRRV